MSPATYSQLLGPDSHRDLAANFGFLRLRHTTCQGDPHSNWQHGKGEGEAECARIYHTCHNVVVPTLLLPRALLEMLESLLATISTSLAKIPMHVELSSPVRQLGGGVHKLDSCSSKVSMGRVGRGREYNHSGEGVKSQMLNSVWFTGPQTHSSLCSPPSLVMGLFPC